MGFIVVPAEKIVQWRKDHKKGSDESEIVDAIRRAFVPSSRSSRGGGNHAHPPRRRHQFSFPVIIQENLGLQFEKKDNQSSEKILQKILMEFNRLSTSNLDAVIQALQKMEVLDLEVLQRIASILLQKISVEKNFRHFYITLIDQMYWKVSAEYFYDLRTCFLLETQKTFETIADLSKEEGCQIMATLGIICHTTSWLPEEVYHRIIEFLLNKKGGKSSNEYIITFMRNCPDYSERQEVIANLLKSKDLPMRLRMLLENL